MSESAVTAYGRLPWSGVLDVLTGFTGLWMDLDGVHVASPPEQAPFASHVWAWRDDGSAARVRVDGDFGIVAVLAAGEHDPSTVDVMQVDVVAGIGDPIPSLEAVCDVRTSLVFYRRGL